ncbi:MAG: hypothetical protein ACYCS1_05215 [Gammaproteobacteria bacterium]
MGKKEGKKEHISKFSLTKQGWKLAVVLVMAFIIMLFFTIMSVHSQNQNKIQSSSPTTKQTTSIMPLKTLTTSTTTVITTSINPIKNYSINISNINQSIGIANPNMELILPNPNQRKNAPRFIYIPIMTLNNTLAKYIQTYAPVALQNPLVTNGVLGKGFQSKYTFIGQMEYSDLGKLLIHYNSSLSIYEGN